ncbi:MAG: hypothetical protein ABH811_00020 [archaeon]
MKKILILVLAVFLISFAFAQDASYCCEKTKVQNDGSGSAWCQNAPEEKCDQGFKKSPTSCEATSYCRMGTCYDSQEGTCKQNTPQKVCEDEGGVWEEGYPENLPQCSLGCCLMQDQAAFVTQVRCKRLSSLYGLEIDFRTNIQNEIECIASATSDVKGACVFEKEFEKTCLFIPQKECKEMQTSETETSFEQGVLCSAERLGTNCGPTEQTKCVEGLDEVYFVDSCGNLANIYDASKIKDKTYWSDVVDKSKSCGFGDSKGNANSMTCGNCDYYLGSTCKVKNSGDAKLKYGNSICRDLSCTYEGKKYKHGETWCEDSSGINDNLPGSRYFRMVCYNGEVSVEPCADFRQERCIESDVNSFRTAACRVNQWQDCYSQDSRQDCINKDKRDCKWVQTMWTPQQGDVPGLINSKGGACVPEFAPGFDFWQEGDAESLCSTATTKCVVLYEKGFVGGGKCIQNCECLGDAWKKQMNQICMSVGDCGSSKNYIGAEGYH